MFDLITKILRGARRLKRSNTAPDDLVSIAATHFAQDFPNPNGHDCPPPGALSELVSSGLLPSNDLREHMLMCSECFANYRMELTRHRADQAVRITGRVHRSRRTRLVPILAGGSAAAVAILAVFLLSRSYRSVTETAQLPNPVNAPVAADENVKPKLTAPETTTTQPPSKSKSVATNRRSSSISAIAPNKVTVNSENYNPLRGGVLAQPPPVLLQTARNKLVIKLPADSPKGTYTVNFSNPWGRSLRSVEAISRDGVQLRLKLNLSSVKPGNYLICLARQTEVPQCIPTVLKSVGNKE